MTSGNRHEESGMGDLHSEEDSDKPEIECTDCGHVRHPVGEANLIGKCPNCGSGDFVWYNASE